MAPLLLALVPAIAACDSGPPTSLTAEAVAPGADDDAASSGEDDGDDDCVEGVCMPELFEQCHPQMAAQVRSCADEKLRAVELQPEDGSLTGLDVLGMCTETDELVSLVDRVCEAPAEICSVDAEIVAEAQAGPCYDALEAEFEAEIELTEVMLSEDLLDAVDKAVQQRCPDALCSVEVHAFTWGEQHPDLHSTALAVADLIHPELADGAYNHSTAWDLDQDLDSLGLSAAIDDARDELQLRVDTTPAVGRLFTATPAGDGVDLLLESYTALFRQQQVILSITIAQPTV